MATNIGEPFLLSHYDNHRRDSFTVPYVTHEQSSGSKVKEGCATITVHGDGVHVFDVRSFQKFLCMYAQVRIPHFYPVISPACCWIPYSWSINDIRWSIRLSHYNGKWYKVAEDIRRN